MRVGVVGAGAIGTYVATRLHQAGHSVKLLVRQSQVDSLTSSGLRIHLRGATLEHHVEVVDRLSSPVDLVLMTVKTQDLEPACAALSGVGDDATVVTLQNGVRADGIVAARLGCDRLVGGVATCAVISLEPGVACVEVPGWFVVGDPWQRPNPRVPTVARVLRDVAPTLVTSDLPSTRWTKLIGNLTNGVTAATGLSLAELGRSRVGRDVLLKVLREGHRVVGAAGIRLDHHFYWTGWSDGKAALVALLQSLVSTLLPVLPEAVSSGLLAAAARTQLGKSEFRGSTWQSLARGRSTEIDYLNGEIVRLGCSIHMLTPYNSRVLEAVHAAERTNHVFTVRELCPGAR